uniref:Ankyrin repeat and EF-hand domain containing 1 n=1 Tax=Latimeria chalumnae TaxID=7897 RepID=H3A1L0_LATCH
MSIAQGRLEILQVYKLLQCVRQNDKKQIGKLIKFGIANLINFAEPNEGECALHLASVANNIDMCKFLLELGAHPNVQDKQGRTPFMKAAELGHDQLLELLAFADADMTLVDNDGQGILFYCVCPTKRHTQCVQIALEHGADPNNRSLNGKPALLFTCEQAQEQECKEMCLQILEKGADPNGMDEESGRTVLMEAANAGATEVVRVILQKGGKVNTLDKGRYHAGHYAAKGGFFQILRALSAYGGDLGVIAMDGNTPLHLAAKGGFADCCKFIVQRGCNPKLKNQEGKTARAVAKESAHKPAMKEIRKGERYFTKYSKPQVHNPNEPWAILFYDWSLEHEKVLRSAFEVMDLGDGTVAKEDFALVIQGKEAPIEFEDLQKIMQVHDKNRLGSVNINEFFKGSKYLQKTFLMASYEPKKKKGKKGGKKGKASIPLPICIVPENLIHRRDDGGPPHFMIESYRHFTDYSRFSRDHPPVHPLQDDSAWYLDWPDKSFTNVNYAVKADDIESLNRAFAQGVPVDVRDRFYKTPLMAACASGNFEVAKFLIAMGADVNASDNFKWTPLHHACHAGQLDIIQLLVNSGVQIDTAAINGSTPLMRAVESCRLECVQYLINCGAKVQLQNKKEQNALDISREYTDLRIYEVVKAKLDSLPKPKDKKGKGKGKGKAPAVCRGLHPTIQHTVSKMADRYGIDITKQKKEILHESVLYQQSLITSGAVNKVDITFVPRTVWGHQPTTEELIKKREARRERFTYEVDFDDFMMPFKKNFMTKSIALGGPNAK